MLKHVSTRSCIVQCYQAMPINYSLGLPYSDVMVRHTIGPSHHWSDTPLVRHTNGPTHHWFDTPLVRHTIGLTNHKRDHKYQNLTRMTLNFLINIVQMADILELFLFIFLFECQVPSTIYNNSTR